MKISLSERSEEDKLWFHIFNFNFFYFQLSTRKESYRESRRNNERRWNDRRKDYRRGSNYDNDYHHDNHRDGDNHRVYRVNRECSVRSSRYPPSNDNRRRGSDYRTMNHRSSKRSASSSPEYEKGERTTRRQAQFGNCSK